MSVYTENLLTSVKSHLEQADGYEDSHIPTNAQNRVKCLNNAKMATQRLLEYIECEISKESNLGNRFYISTPKSY